MNLRTYIFLNFHLLFFLLLLQCVSFPPFLINSSRPFLFMLLSLFIFLMSFLSPYRISLCVGRYRFPLSFFLSTLFFSCPFSDFVICVHPPYLGPFLFPGSICLHVPLFSFFFSVSLFFILSSFPCFLYMFLLLFGPCKLYRYLPIC